MVVTVATLTPVLLRQVWVWTELCLEICRTAYGGHIDLCWFMVIWEMCDAITVLYCVIHFSYLHNSVSFALVKYYFTKSWIYFWTVCARSWSSVVSTVTGLSAGQQRNYGPISGIGKIFFTSLQLSAWHLRPI